MPEGGPSGAGKGMQAGAAARAAGLEAAASVFILVMRSLPATWYTYHGTHVAAVLRSFGKLATGRDRGNHAMIP